MAINLDMIGLVVADIDRSLAFYRLLGLEVERGEGPYCETKLANGLRISWNHVDMIKEIDPHYVSPVGQRLGLAFLCDSPGEVDSMYERLVGAGYRGAKEPWDAFWGQRYAQIEDPDGIVLDLFAPLTEG